MANWIKSIFTIIIFFCLLSNGCHKNSTELETEQKEETPIIGNNGDNLIAFVSTRNGGDIA